MDRPDVADQLTLWPRDRSALVYRLSICFRRGTPPPAQIKARHDRRLDSYGSSWRSSFDPKGRTEVGVTLRHVLLEFFELFLFLLSVTSFVNTMVERNVFESLRSRLTILRLSNRDVFWLATLSRPLDLPPVPPIFNG